jgi:hypothetical protein
MGLDQERLGQRGGSPRSAGGLEREPSRFDRDAIAALHLDLDLDLAPAQILRPSLDVPDAMTSLERSARAGAVWLRSAIDGSRTFDADLYAGCAASGACFGFRVKRANDLLVVRHACSDEPGTFVVQRADRRGVLLRVQLEAAHEQLLRPIDRGIIQAGVRSFQGSSRVGV